ncbi:hypothetical protein JOB18_030682 [Solea senegalensis]|uniref:Uncharacterized protein n=1 Tax=Solea senegalensis TaxID=28829 RepID=A0AAV6RX62_SOLSE|nr:hypothetical protein JOB18_030682 [Solea senegalensis]
MSDSEFNIELYMTRQGRCEHRRRESELLLPGWPRKSITQCKQHFTNANNKCRPAALQHYYGLEIPFHS